MKRKKVLISKIGLDGHDVGAKVIVKFLREHGFDVQYLGIRKEVEDIIIKAKEFKPDCVGISILTGGHLHLIPTLRKEMNKNNLKNTKLVCGGILPKKDKKALLKNVDAIFSNDSSLDEIVTFFKTCI
jgi:methylmalonyl-CoA mutase C-terminal domain/subunit